MRPARTCYAAAILLTVGCSSVETAGGTAGTGSGSAGVNAGGSTSGSGGATGASNRPRGAVSLAITTPSGCPLTEQFFDLPQAASGRPVTNTERTAWLADGESTAEGDPVHVSCSFVADLGPPFLVGVEIRLGQGAHFSLDGFIEPGAESKDFLSVSMAGPEFGDTYTGVGGSCVFSAIEGDPVARSFWGKLTCTAVQGVKTPGTCALGASFMAFENCGVVPQNG
jgi:hypothetical protein